MSNSDAAVRTVHVVIEGRVQGVGFRDWTECQATRLGLTGWVRNRRDGAVEAVFSGAPGVVEDMLGRCQRGPPSAWVQRVAIIGEPAASYSGFDVLF